MSGIETKSPLSHLIFTFSLGDCNPHFRNETEACLIQGHSATKSGTQTQSKDHVLDHTILAGLYSLNFKLKLSNVLYVSSFKRTTSLRIHTKINK